MPKLKKHAGGDVQVVADAGAADRGERAGVVALVILDEPEGRLPGPVGVPDGVPQLPAGGVHADDLQLAVDAAAAGRDERAGIVLFLGFDAPGIRRPGSVEQVVPQPPVSPDTDELKLVTDARAAHRRQRAVIGAWRPYDGIEGRLPVGGGGPGGRVPDRVPERIADRDRQRRRADFPLAGGESHCRCRVGPLARELTTSNTRH